jgi:hypothetical protein
MRVEDCGTAESDSLTLARVDLGAAKRKNEKLSPALSRLAILGRRRCECDAVPAP